MNNFQHQHTAHCESGVMSTLLKSHGADLNEAMVFGLASALTFVYLPVIKVGGMPLISYRMPPKSILRRIKEKKRWMKPFPNKNWLGCKPLFSGCLIFRLKCVFILMRTI